MASTILPDDVAAIAVDELTPPASGYGTGVRTRFHLTLTDGRRRRVCVDVYGNGGGTPYVTRAGQRAYLSAAVEAMAYDGAAGYMSDERARELAAMWQSPGAVGRELATLASTGEATADLADDIRATMAGVDPFTVDYFQLAALLGYALSR